MDIEAVLDRSCWVIDALPRQVPAGSPGQFFAVERYLLHGPERDVFARRAARILLKLSCYCELSLFYPRSERTLETPAPETVRDMIRAVGGPVRPAEIGVDAELFRRAMLEAMNLRPQYSMLKHVNAAGKLEEYTEVVMKELC